MTYARGVQKHNCYNIRPKYFFYPFLSFPKDPFKIFFFCLLSPRESSKFFQDENPFYNFIILKYILKLQFSNYDSL